MLPNLSESQMRTDCERLADIFTVLQRCFLMNLSKELSRGKVSFPQYFLLGFLAQKEFLTMSEIAAKMSHTTAAATGLVDRLEKLGYVRRTHASDDRRKIEVQITGAGLQLGRRNSRGYGQQPVQNDADALAERAARLAAGVRENFHRLREATTLNE